MSECVQVQEKIQRAISRSTASQGATKSSTLMNTYDRTLFVHGHFTQKQVELSCCTTRDMPIRYPSFFHLKQLSTMQLFDFLLLMYESYPLLYPRPCRTTFALSIFGQFAATTFGCSFDIGSLCFEHILCCREKKNRTRHNAG